LSLWKTQLKAQTCTLQPADPKATAQVKNLLCYLKTNTYISGQTDLKDGDYVKQMTGNYPAIIAFDFYNYTNGDNVGNTSETQKAIDWAKSTGGIVAFQWHWRCPLGGGNFDGNCDFVPYLDNPNSALYRNIDLVISELKKMGDAGVPVLFRPLHEANNNYMWWAKKGQDAYIKLFRLFYNRAQLAGAHNIIWVFNGMANGQNTSMASWYPGDQYVDVVSSDYFQNYNDFNTCKAIGTNKVMGVAETFNALDPAKDPAWNYSIVWASRDWGGKGAEQSWKDAMANAKTITINEIPDFYTVAISANAGADQELTSAGIPISVNLNGSASIPSTGKSISSYVWKENNTQIATGVNPQISLPLGKHVITLTVTDSDNKVASDEVIIYVRTPNLALTKQVAVSSTETGFGNIASHLTDGKTDTRWSSEYSDLQDFTVDLGAVFLLNEIVLKWEAAYAKSYKIEVSTDKVNWLELYQTLDGKGGKEDLTFKNEYGRYVKFTGLKRATVYGYSLYEVEVYGESVVTGINKASENSLFIYPNPTNDKVYLHRDYEAEWEIYSIMGNSVLKGISNEISLENLQKGTYILSTENQKIKLIKQ
jgi:hypothetical protein